MDATHASTMDRTAPNRRQPSHNRRSGAPVVVSLLLTAICLLAAAQRRQHAQDTGYPDSSQVPAAEHPANHSVADQSLRQRADLAPLRRELSPYIAAAAGPWAEARRRATELLSSAGAVRVAFAAAEELLPDEAGPLLPEDSAIRPLSPVQQWHFRSPSGPEQVPVPQEAIVAPAEESREPSADNKNQLRFVPLRPLPSQQSRSLLADPPAPLPPSTTAQPELAESIVAPPERRRGIEADAHPPASTAQERSEALEEHRPLPLLPPPETSPLEPSVHFEDRSEQLEMIARQADRHTLHGFELADRGAIFAARAEFIKALRLVAQGLDAEYRTDKHSRALSAGLTALEEAGDFVPDTHRLEASVDIHSIIGSHVTPVLKNANRNQLSPLLCMQCYLSFAQEQLAAAVGKEIAGSMALCALGKVYSTLALQRNSAAQAAEPKAVTCYQAALLVYPGNFMAANELGVLHARYGNYAAARAALEHSVRIHPHAAGWRNLAVVYRQLGHPQLAAQAARQAEDISRRQFAQQASRLQSGGVVQWVEPERFAQTARDVPVATPLPAMAQPADGRKQTQPPSPAAKASKPTLPAPLAKLLEPSVARRNGEPTVQPAPSRH